MIVTKFDIDEVRLVHYDYKTGLVKVKVFTSDSPEPISLECSIKTDLEQAAIDIVNKVKRIKTPIDKEEGILGGISIVNVLNRDEVVEGIFKGLVRVDAKIENMKRVRIASEYMKVFQQVNTMQDVLFRKA